MKKLFCLSLAAACLAVAPQQASAWSNTQFSIGLNYQHQAGDNYFGKHLWHSGQVPGYGGSYGGFGGPVGGPFPGMYPGPVGFPADAAVSFPPAPMPVAPAAPVSPAPAPAKQAAEGNLMNPYHYANYENSYFYPQPVYYYGW